MKKVLVVDDSVMWRRVVSEIVASEGCVVETAVDGLDGYNKAFQFLPDVIFTDVVMPKLNGYHLCRLLKNSKTFKHAGIIILTTLDESINKFWAYKSGADGFIQKSSVEEIKNEILKYLSRKEFKVGWEEIGKEIHQPFVELSSLLDKLLLKETIKNEMASLFSYLTDEDHVLWKLSDLLFNVLSIKSLAVMILSPQGGTIFATSKEGKFHTESLKERLYSVLSKPAFPTAWKITGDAVADDGKIPVKEMLVSPIIFEDEEIGALAIHPGNLSDEEREVLEEITANLGNLFRLVITYSMAVTLAKYDELTGLNNYRSLMEKLSEYFNLSKRQDLDFSVGIVDIDHFKKVNDTYGHLVGNDVLKTLAGLLKESFRSTDVVGRYGGEEFVVGMIQVSPEEALEALERFRKRVEEFDWEKVHPGLRITVSAGVTSRSIKNYRTVMEMIEDADEALYASKESGRNRVTVYGRRTVNEDR